MTEDPRSKPGSPTQAEPPDSVRLAPEDPALSLALVPEFVWPLVTAAEMRALDQYTIDELAIPADVLMESAGRAIASEVLRVQPLGRPVVVVCGRGNNGGDGLVAARHIHQSGVAVEVALLGPLADVSEDAARNLERARAVGVRVAECESGLRFPTGPGVIVDAIFGTGLSRDVTGPIGEAIRAINSHRAAHDDCQVVAADLPSGVCSDRGCALGVAVQADVTVALGLPKLAHAIEPARTLAGRVVVARIGIADTAPSVSAAAELWTAEAVSRSLPARNSESHKGTFGHVLIAAGSEGKTGAAALSAAGAARGGAGLVTIACPAGLNDILEIKCTEAMTVPVADTDQRGFAASGAETVVALSATRAAVGMGPGLGRDVSTQAFAVSVAKRVDVPLVIDADGLMAFADEPGLLAGRAAPTVLTPHPGEASALMGIAVSEINADRPAAARALARTTGAIVLLKGAATVIASPDGRIAINPTGGPALATGGTGDVLLGIVTALIAQRVAPFEATVLAAFLHGAAADRIAVRSGESGLLAGDLADEIPATMAALRGRATDRPSREIARNGLVLSFPEP